MDDRPAAGKPSTDALVARPGFAARLSGAIPSPQTIVFGSVAWGAAMLLSALAGLYFRNGLYILKPVAALTLYFYGAALAFAPALFIETLIFGRASRPVRVVGAALLMFVATHVATAGIFALQYRVFYSHWHANFPSVVWGFQLVFTSASALYQFTVDSLYLYLPLSPLAFLGFGLWFARRAD